MVTFPALTPSEFFLWKSFHSMVPDAAGLRARTRIFGRWETRVKCQKGSKWAQKWLKKNVLLHACGQFLRYRKNHRLPPGVLKKHSPFINRCWSTGLWRDRAKNGSKILLACKVRDLPWMQPRVRDLKGVFALYGIFFDQKNMPWTPFGGPKNRGFFWGARVYPILGRLQRGIFL